MPARYQREIEEILDQSGSQGAGQAAPSSPRAEGGSPRWKLRVPQALGFSGWRVSPGKLMLASFAILLSALLLNAFSAPAVGLVAWSGVALFIVAYALFFILPPKSRAERRWRGRPVDYGHPSWRDRLRRWFKT